MAILKAHGDKLPGKQAGGNMSAKHGMRRQGQIKLTKPLIITTNFILSVILVVLVLTKFLTFSLESMSQLALIVNLVTLLTLFRYAYDTYRMADSQKAFNYTPIISHGFPESEWEQGNGEVQLFIKNYSPFDVRVNLWVDIWYDDKLLEYDAEFDRLAYQGKARWVMCAKEGSYQGHFRFGNHMLQHNALEHDLSLPVERNKHKIIFKLRYEAMNNISDQVFKSETYAYELKIMKSPDYNKNTHEYKIKEFISLIPQVL